MQIVCILSCCACLVFSINSFGKKHSVCKHLKKQDLAFEIYIYKLERFNKNLYIKIRS